MREKELYEEPEIIEVGETRISDAMNVGQESLGMADIDRRTIYIPTFAKAYADAINRGDGFMRGVIDGVKAYIFGHEKYVELEGRPKNDKQEIALEAGYLQRLEYQAIKDDSFAKWAIYLSGLTLHKKRAENNGEGSWFSNVVDKLYSIRSRLDQYKTKAKNFGHYIDKLY